MFRIADSFVMNIVAFIPGLLSHDVDDDDQPKKAYTPTNWFSGDESKR